MLQLAHVFWIFLSVYKYGHYRKIIQIHQLTLIQAIELLSLYYT